MNSKDLSYLFNDSSSDFFAPAFSDGPLKYFSIVTTTVFIIFLIPSGYGIVWYEHYGADSKRILINRCVASVCWTGIEFYVIVWPIDITRYVFGPLPEGVCLFQLMLKNVINMQTVLFCDAVSVARYLFIFYIKNPSAFQDEFWHTFINIWVVSCGLLSQFVFVYLPGHQPLIFFLCSGQNPLSDGTAITVKKNYVFSISLILSIILQVSVAAKLVTHRMKLDSKTTYAYIDNFRKENSFDILMCSAFLFLALIYGYLVFSIQTVEPALINAYPNYLFVYGLHFGFPLIGCTTLTLFFYTKNKHLTLTLWEELLDLLKRK